MRASCDSGDERERLSKHEGFLRRRSETKIGARKKGKGASEFGSTEMSLWSIWQLEKRRENDLLKR